MTYKLQDDGKCDHDCPWRGLTYWYQALGYKWIYWIWRQVFCRFDIHLFDEVHSGDSSSVPPSYKKYNHSLHCDACQLMVGIAGICEYDEWLKAFNEHNYNEDGSLKR